MKRMPETKGAPLQTRFGAGLIRSIRSKAGFTLIELLVTTAVMMIIMGSVAGTGIARRTQFNLSINQEKLRTLVSRAKGLTLNSLIEQGSDICGYGVHIERERAFIFADRSATCSASDRIYTSSSEDFPGGINELQAEAGIFFYDMSSGGVTPPSFGNGAGKIDVLFVPPDPTTYVNGVMGGSTTIGVAASSRDWRKVIVEGSGLISTRSY